MPFIKREARRPYDFLFNQLSEIKTKGDLEYCVYKLLKIYMSTRKYRYTPLHEAVYAAIHAGEEFKRQYLDKREDTARKTNGDIS